MIDIRCCDVLDGLRAMPDASVQCCVTSPPYYALRDYGVAGQIGLEPTLAEFLAKLVDVFAEVRRVLRPDGIAWVNMGDSYASSPGKGGSGPNGKNTKEMAYARGASGRVCEQPAKNLLGVPWRLAFALQDDGWILRSECIWHKPNPMPESVTDRPTKSHEHVFLFSKEPRYFYDADAVREDAKYGRREWAGKHFKEGDTTVHHGGSTTGSDPSAGRNLRTVWTIATEPLSEAHFAAFPQALARNCIEAGTSAHGCCSECGMPWARQTKRDLIPGPKAAKTFVVDDRDLGADANDQGSNRQKDGHKPGYVTRVETLGWLPSCQCAAAVVPCVVLDPFCGAGTTGLVAIGLGRRFVGLEINPEYVKLAKRRIQAEVGIFAAAIRPKLTQTKEPTQ